LSCVAVRNTPLAILSHVQLWAKPGTAKRHEQREVQELTKPSQTATEAFVCIWLESPGGRKMGEVQCGSYFTETWYLPHRFDTSLVSFLFASCPCHLASPTNVCVPSAFSAAFVVYHQLRANRNLTKNKDLVNLSITCRPKNCRIDF